MELIEKLRSGCGWARCGEINEDVTNELMSEAADTIERMMPMLDILQERLSDECYIKLQAGRWYIFDGRGESVCSGESIREMLVNLIFVDC